MLRILLKKQFAEIFKTYFYNPKKNRMRSKAGIAGWFLFFFVIIFGMFGGLFAFLSASMCGTLVTAGLGWFYFLLLGLIATMLGVFGSVFNTYASLYLAKDNDQLLCLPIPVKTIMTARLMNVYLMGALYTTAAFLPALIVYWIAAGTSVSKVVCGLLLLLILTVIVLFLSCLLGWLVAKISLRLKNRSFTTVLVALLFFGVYYLFFFKLQDILNNILQNAMVYGDAVKGAAYVLYLLGRIGEGAVVPAVIFTIVSIGLLALLFALMTRSFLSIATASGKTGKVRYVEKQAKEKPVFGAVLGKEFARFTSSPNYMLNCGLGLLFIPVIGVLVLWKGEVAVDVLNSVFSGMPGTAAVLFCTALLTLTSMTDIAAPSLSLEGKSLWIPQSLPVTPATVLRAKVSVQVILTSVPMLFAAVCAAIVVKESPAVRLLVLAVPMLYTVFSALYGMFIGVKMPLLNWTDETAPIKQGGAVTLVLFSSWGFCAVFAALYMLFAYRIGPVLYLSIWAAVFAVGALLLLRWLNTKGSRIFAAL